jgi:hypothetical protein
MVSDSRKSAAVKEDLVPVSKYPVDHEVAKCAPTAAPGVFYMIV